MCYYVGNKFTKKEKQKFGVRFISSFFLSSQNRASQFDPRGQKVQSKFEDNTKVCYIIMIKIMAKSADFLSDIPQRKKLFSTPKLNNDQYLVMSKLL